MGIDTGTDESWRGEERSGGCREAQRSSGETAAEAEGWETQGRDGADRMSLSGVAD